MPEKWRKQMPKEFENCVKNGGKVITKKVNANQYIHVCYLNGKSYSGEVKDYKKVLKK